VALVGPTGSGKSTILSLIAKFHLPGAGEVLIDGREIRTLTGDGLRQQMGNVLQNNFLFSGTVMDNIRIGRPAASDDEIRTAAESLGVRDLIEDLPQSFDTRVGEKGRGLSLGQRQIVCFCRAMLADPRILLLDEATSAVDRLTEVRLQRALARLLRGRTSFVVAHRLSTIRHADKLLVIESGRVVESGTHSELVARGGLYSSLHRAFVRATATSGATRRPRARNEDRGGRDAPGSHPAGAAVHHHLPHRHRHRDGGVLVRDERGHIGLGAASPESHVTGETNAACQAALAAGALDWLVGEDLRTLPTLARRLGDSMHATPAARAAVDMALHDLLARALDLPLCDLLGRVHRRLPTSITIGIKNAAETLREVDEYLGRGFRAIKVKVGRAFEEDVDRLRQLRARVGPGVTLRADANQGYTLEQTRRFLAETRRWIWSWSSSRSRRATPAPSRSWSPTIAACWWRTRACSRPGCVRPGGAAGALRGFQHQADEMRRGLTRAADRLGGGPRWPGGDVGLHGREPDRHQRRLAHRLRLPRHPLPRSRRQLRPRARRGGRRIPPAGRLDEH
jgi:ABC-type multidrug transport system ATPase subunit